MANHPAVRHDQAQNTDPGSQKPISINAAWYYYNHFFDRDRNARDCLKDHPHFQACADFCEKYDQNAFDPNFQSVPLEAFEPMVRRVFARTPDFFADANNSAA